MDLEQIIKCHEKLIYKLASKFYDVNKEDLYQAGVIGLIKAYNNYENNNDTKFTTYAYNYIFGEMYEFANLHRTIKINKDVLRLFKKIEQAKDVLAQKLNHVPNIAEISAFLNIPELTIAEIYQATSSILSLDYKEDEERPIYETVAMDSKVPLANIIDIQDSINTLTKEEKDIINYRYFKDYTQTETAKILGLSQVTVSRYEKKGLNKMYNYLVS